MCVGVYTPADISVCVCTRVFMCAADCLQVTTPLSYLVKYSLLRLVFALIGYGFSEVRNPHTTMTRLINDFKISKFSILLLLLLLLLASSLWLLSPCSITILYSLGVGLTCHIYLSAVSQRHFLEFTEGRHFSQTRKTLASELSTIPCSKQRQFYRSYLVPFF